VRILVVLGEVRIPGVPREVRVLGVLGEVRILVPRDTTKNCVCSGNFNMAVIKNRHNYMYNTTT